MAGTFLCEAVRASVVVRGQPHTKVSDAPRRYPHMHRTDSMVIAVLVLATLISILVMPTATLTLLAALVAYRKYVK
jgi:hypothetical protein